MQLTGLADAQDKLDFEVQVKLASVESDYKQSISSLQDKLEQSMRVSRLVKAVGLALNILLDSESFYTRSRIKAGRKYRL